MTSENTLFQHLKKRIKSNNGFMGLTHVTSAIAAFLLIIAFIPAFWFEITGADDFMIIFASAFVVAGAALIPDLDNTRSSAMSALGILGVGLSKVFRTIASGVYYLTKTKKDKPVPDPHRGFWHTIPAVILMFFLCLGTTSIGGVFYSDLLKRNITVGTGFAAAWMFFCFLLAISVLDVYILGKDTSASVPGTILNIALSLGLVYLVLRFNSSVTYRWLAFTVAFGYFIHILGDTLTASGTPCLWPLKIRGKRWYDIRLAKIRAGGVVEKKIVLPLFVVLIIFSILKIAIWYFG